MISPAKTPTPTPRPLRNAPPSTVNSPRPRAQGLPVELVSELGLPFHTYGAVKLADQVQLHPVRYAQGLAAAVTGDGSHGSSKTPTH